MSVRPPVLMLVLAAAATAQAPRLVDRIESPIAYVRIAGEPERPSAADERDAAGWPTLQGLLADPGLDRFFRAADGGASAAAWRFVRGVVGRRRGEFELALTGIVPGAGRPLIVMRVQLQQPEAERLQGLLQQGGVAESHRTVAGQPTFRLRDRTPPTDSRPTSAGPGELVELAIVGSDLVVANDSLGMQELLSPERGGTSASPTGAVLSENPAFVGLHAQLGGVPGAMVAYGDWPRLGHRLQHALTGVPGALLQWSGLGEARHVLMSLAPSGAAFEATLLLAFEAPAATGAVPAIDGWLSAAQRVAAKQLMPELPATGLGGVVLAVDLADLATRSHRGEHLLRDLRHSFDDYGLDFDRNVLGRLGSLGTMQLLLHEGTDGGAAVVAPVYAVRAKSRGAAAELFADLRRAAEAHGIGRLVEGKDRRTPDVLELRPGHEPADRSAAPICVAVVDDSVLVTFDTDTIRRVHDDYRRAAKGRGRRDAVLAAAMQRVGAVPISGLFDIDLAGWFASLTGSGSGGAAVPDLPDLSGLPSRHVGCLALVDQPGGTVVRVSLLSSR